MDGSAEAANGTGFAYNFAVQAADNGLRGLARDAWDWPLRI